MTVGDEPLADRDVDARGVTSFHGSETRATQLAVSAAVLRAGALKARTSRNPLDWVLVGGVTSLLKRSESGRWHDYFYAEANQWKLQARSERRLIPSRDGRATATALTRRLSLSLWQRSRRSVRRSRVSWSMASPRLGC